MDANAMDRMLLLSSKPYLHLNVDCNAIVGAIVSRQTAVVELLLRVSILWNTILQINVVACYSNLGTHTCKCHTRLYFP